ncbi:MAG: glycosyl hydrolase-related protein, partial [Kiritimatiellia bacterium]
YEPDPLPEAGLHELRLALRPFGGVMSVTEAIRIGQTFSRPALVIATDLHKGLLPPSASFVKLHTSTAVLTALKKAEDEDALLFRFLAPTGKRAQVELAPMPGILPAFVAGEEVDLLEQSLRSTSVGLRGGSVRFNLSPHGIVSVRVRLKQRQQQRARQKKGK